MALARCKSFRKKIPITTNEKKSSAIARVNKKIRTLGLIVFPARLRTPIARATSVGIATAHACEPWLRNLKIRAGRIIPERAQRAGNIASFAFSRPSRISNPMRIKKMKVRISESTG
jgi:hypothetical protein